MEIPAGMAHDLDHRLFHFAEPGRGGKPAMLSSSALAATPPGKCIAVPSRRLCSHRLCLFRNSLSRTGRNQTRIKRNKIDALPPPLHPCGGEGHVMMELNGSDRRSSSSVFLSTAALPARDRLAIWREVFGRKIVLLDIEPAKGTSFYADGEICALPGVAFASVTASPVRAARTQQLIADDMANMVFAITADAPLHIAQGGKEHALEVGDAIFLRGSECSVIQCHEKTRFTNISVPHGDLASILPNCEDISMTVVNRRTAALGLLAGYVGVLQSRQGPVPDELGRMAASHIRDLMAAMIMAEPDCGSQPGERGGVRAARLRAIKADIGMRLCEPGLCIDSVAMRHGISPRYVRKLFQEEQTTFADFVLHLRLERSWRILRNPQHATSTIASIAHACGFGDLSYFNRTFRRQYAITPSDLRNGFDFLS